MLVAVFHDASGVKVMRPNMARKPAGETERAYVTRIAQQDGPKSPSTAGLPFVVVDESALPPQRETDAQGDRQMVRNAWRWDGAQVVVDQAQRPPELVGLLERLRASVPAADWPAGVLADLSEAVRLKDTAAAQESVSRLRSASNLATQAVIDAVRAAKRV